VGWSGPRCDTVTAGVRSYPSNPAVTGPPKPPSFFVCALVYRAHICTQTHREIAWLLHHPGPSAPPPPHPTPPTHTSIPPHHHHHHCHSLPRRARCQEWGLNQPTPLAPSSRISCGRARLGGSSWPGIIQALRPSFWLLPSSRTIIIHSFSFPPHLNQQAGTRRARGDAASAERSVP